MVTTTIPVNDFDLVITGGTGNLARRKILPGLFWRMCAGQYNKDALNVAQQNGSLLDSPVRVILPNANIHYAD